MAEPRIDEVLEEVKRQLAKPNPLMETLLDLMIVSEVWSDENGLVHVMAWVPDMVEGRPRYRLKHIVYDPSTRRVIRVVNAREPVAAPA